MHRYTLFLNEFNMYGNMVNFYAYYIFFKFYCVGEMCNLYLLGSIADDENEYKIIFILFLKNRAEG